MSDDSFSASELRKRNLKGGSLSDDQLSAAQLRARHGIESNRRDWATGEGGSGGILGPAAISIIGLLLLALAAWVLMRKGDVLKA